MSGPSSLVDALIVATVRPVCVAAEVEGALRLWFTIVERASWTGPAEVRAVFGSADFLQDNRIVFDIRGNNYRLIAQVKYGPLFLVYIRFIGTHAEYDRIDASTI